MAKICIDAGHYGTYNTCPGNSKYSEAKVMWKLHLYEKEYLEKLGHTVILTRSNQEKDLDLVPRGKAAKGCDLFMSDHTNAVGSSMNESVDYVVVYYLTDDTTTNIDEKSKVIATELSKVIANVMGTKQACQAKTRKAESDRNGDGIKNDNYYGVLHGARVAGVPAVLPEHSFHTNTKIVNWLLVDANVKKLAKAKAEYIHKYFTGQVVDADKIGTTSTTTTTTTTNLYRVRKSWDDAKSQIGAYANLDNAKAACKDGYYVFDWNGKVVYPEVKTEPVVEQYYRIRKSWDDVKSQVAAYKSLDSAKKNCPAGYTVYDWNGNAVYTNTPQVTVEENTELYRVRKSWDDAKSQIGAYKVLDNAKAACKDGYYVFDSKGNVVYPQATNVTTPTPEVEEPKVEEPVDNTPEDQRLYRVRKTWTDEKSQLGAYKNKENAIQSCKVGYTVYDWNGNAVYTNENDIPEAVDISPLKGLSQNAFIEYVGQLANEDMQKTGVLASVTVAQACLESAYGQSELSLKANNLFGMKSSLSGNTWASEWDGKIYAKRTAEEYTEGEITYILADFRAYDNPAKSIKDHSDYLCGAMNGSKLRYEGLKGETDYKKAIQIIKDGGYATDSKYVDKIISLIEKYNLARFDESEVKDEPVVNPTPEEPKEDDTTKEDIKDIKNTLSMIINVFVKIAELILSVFKK